MLRTINRHLIVACGLCLAGFFSPQVSRGAMIPLVNGDFSSAAGEGSVGGAVNIGASTSAIGAGPWTGTFNGLKISIFNLAAPTLAIANGRASIAGVADLLGVQNNGYFSQISTTNYQALTTYTLSATISTGSVLGAGLLNNTGVGIGLTDGSGNLLASSSASPTLASLTLLSGTNYQLQLTYTTGSTASGLIGVRLFDSPSGVANLNLIGGVSFDNITLSSNSINPAATVPEPTSVLLLGLGLMVPSVVVARRQARWLV